MKGIDIFCASQASTAICMSMEQASSSSSSSATIQLGGRAIDRHNPIIKDGRRSSRTLSTPCSSEPPIDPKPYHHLQHPKTKKSDENRKSTSAKPTDKKKKTAVTDYIINKNISKPTDIIKKSWARPNKPGNLDLITPPGSSRCLLSDTGPFFDGLSDYERPVLALVPVDQDKKNQLVVNQDESSTINASKSKPSSSCRSKSSSSDQVVVLRVSLHCRGCEGKVRKHLSRMEGVTSFNIDFAAKKVTIIGDVTPLGVLASVSKVKSAQFWPAAVSSSSSTSTVKSNNIEIKK